MTARTRTARGRKPATGLLRGWDTIAAYVGLSRYQLARYRDRAGFPVCRMGKCVVTSPTLVDAWIMLRISRQWKAQEAKRAHGRSPASDPKGPGGAAGAPAP